MSLTLTRRTALVTGAALPLFFIGRARAAEFTMRYTNSAPASHPVNVRAVEASARIAEATSGQVEIKVYPSSALGPDIDIAKKLQTGEFEMLALSGITLGALVPVGSIDAVGFAFKDYSLVWRAMDGKLGQHIRDEVAKANMVAFGRMWDNGFRQTTTSTKAVRQPGDFHGMKLRVPVSPLSTSMFAALGTTPTAIDFAAVYEALKVGNVEGQENPLALIQAAKLYEVQTYCSLTNHGWSGYWPLVSAQVWGKLPARTQEIISTEFDNSALQQRADLIKLSPMARGDLVSLGLNLNPVDTADFQAALRKAGFYKEWRDKYGDAWTLLEDAVGGLA